MTGGQFVWETTQGWDTTARRRACDWEIVHDTGDGSSDHGARRQRRHDLRGLVRRRVQPRTGPSTAGIDTNYGGSWHTVGGPDITNGGDTPPQRYVFNLASTRTTTDTCTRSTAGTRAGGSRRRRRRPRVRVHQRRRELARHHRQPAGRPGRRPGDVSGPSWWSPPTSACSSRAPARRARGRGTAAGCRTRSRTTSHDARRHHRRRDPRARDVQDLGAVAGGGPGDGGRHRRPPLPWAVVARPSPAP